MAINREEAKRLLKAVHLADPDEVIENEKSVLGVMDNNGEYTPLCSLKSMSLLVGKQKAGKSKLMSYIAASCLTPGGMAPFKSEVECERVVYINTEMANKYTNKLIKEIFAYCGRSFKDRQFLDRIRMYDMGTNTAEEMLAMIPIAIEVNKVDDKPMLLILDGSADLLFDTNDNQESDLFVNEMKTLAIKHGIHIMHCVHANPTDDTLKARGHLGSSIKRKCEVCLGITKDSEQQVFTLEGVDVRNADFQPMHFTYEQSICRLSYIGDYAERREAEELQTIINLFWPSFDNSSRKATRELLLSMTGLRPKQLDNKIKEAKERGLFVNTAQNGKPAVYQWTYQE